MSEIIRVNQPNVIFDESEGIVVIINLVSGHYFRLGEGSSGLWNALASGCTVDGLRQSCRNPDDFTRDWERIHQQLLGHDLVTHDSSNQSTTVTPQPWDYVTFEIEPFTDLEDILGLDPIHEVDPEKGWPHARES